MYNQSSECVAQRVTPAWYKPLFIVLLLVAVTSVILISFSWLFIILAAGAGYGAYFLNSRSNVEYDFILLDNELTVDMVIGASSRKNLQTFSGDKIEIIAPAGSKHLTPFARRNSKTLDYSGIPLSANGGQYEMHYDHKLHVLLTLSEETFNALRLAFPGKVFRNEDFCIY